MNNLSDSQLQVLSNHYSETFGLLKTAVDKRDRLFVYILVVVFALLLYMNAPTTVSDWLNLFVNNQAGGNGNSTKLIDPSFISVILLLSLLSLSHTYFQTVLHIERQYDYVYELEALLSQGFVQKAFTREGQHYKDHRRKFASWTKIIFWYLFPFLFLVFNILWLIFLYTGSNHTILYLAVDSLIEASLFISLGLYLWAIIKKK